MGVQLMSVDEHQAGRHAGDTGPGGWAVGERLSASCPSPAGWRVARHAHATGQRGVARPLLWITLHSWTYCVSVSVSLSLSLSLSLCVCVRACVCVCACVRTQARPAPSRACSAAPPPPPTRSTTALTACTPMTATRGSSPTPSTKASVCASFVSSSTKCRRAQCA